MRPIIAATIAALALTAPAHATTTIGGTPELRADIRLAKEFWVTEHPDWRIPCVEHITLTKLPFNVWAATNLYSCNIEVSEPMWTASLYTDQFDRYNVCIAIAHEYGHTLGYWDDDGPPIMDTAWAPRFDPLCTIAAGMPPTEQDMRWLVRRISASF